MNHKPGTTVPESGLYWCTVCRLPQRFAAGDTFPECPNLCGRCYWRRVEPPAGERA